MSSKDFFGKMDLKKSSILFSSTILMTILKSVVLYFFFFDFFVSYSDLSKTVSVHFFKHLRILFVCDLLIGVFCLSFGKKYSRSILCQWMVSLGFFALTFATYKIEGVFVFPHEGFVFNRILMASWIVWGFSTLLVLCYNFEIRKSSWVGVVFVIICSSILFLKTDWSASREKVYFKKGSIGLLFSSEVGLNAFLKTQREKIIASNQKIVFMHFPKTGGGSLTTILSNYYTYVDIHVHAARQDIKNGKYPFKNKAIVQMHARKIHHKEFGLDKARYFTFMRDPKERILSDYYYLKMMTPPTYVEIKKMTLLEYLKQEKEDFRSKEGHIMDNLYTTYLSNVLIGSDISNENLKEAVESLNEFEFIGFMENYQEDFGDLCDFLYIPRLPEIPRQEHYNKLLIKRERITTEIERELDRLTKYDYIIYEAAKEVAARKRKECKKYGNGVCRMRIK